MAPDVLSRGGAVCPTVRCRAGYVLRDSHTRSPPGVRIPVTTEASVPRRCGANPSMCTLSSCVPVAGTVRLRVISTDVWTSPGSGSGKSRPLISRMAAGKPSTWG